MKFPWQRHSTIHHFWQYPSLSKHSFSDTNPSLVVFKYYLAKGWLYSVYLYQSVITQPCTHWAQQISDKIYLFTVQYHSNKSFTRKLQAHWYNFQHDKDNSRLSASVYEDNLIQPNHHQFISDQDMAGPLLTKIRRH